MSVTVKIQERGISWVMVVKLFFSVAAFLIALQLMILSFKLLSVEAIEQIIIATSNPFISLFIGLLATALVQSSSTVTAMIIAIVASGTINMEQAVYMIMGANIGTTVTSTIVSFGHIIKKKEFRKAIAAGTVHDFFNILTAMILLPLEYFFGVLSGLAKWITYSFSPSKSPLFLQDINPIRIFIDPLANAAIHLTGNNAFISLFIAIVVLFLALKFIAQTIKHILIDNRTTHIEAYLFGNPFKSLLSGIVITALVQSSSIVTSLVVPVVASNKLSLKTAFPFILGANIGTTLKALVLAYSQTDAAFAIALTHFLFNFIGVMIFFPVPAIRNIPIEIARYLGKATLKSRMIGFAYITLSFFIIPFFLIYLTKGSIKIKQYTYVEQNQKTNPYKVTASIFDGDYRFQSKKLFYKQFNVGTDWFHEHTKGNKIVIRQNGDSIFVNRQTFFLKEKGFCWDDRDVVGKYSICVSEVIKNFRLNDAIMSDKCYVFSKKYNSDKHKSIHKVYLDAVKKIIIKHELINPAGKIIGKEELISIVE